MFPKLWKIFLGLSTTSLSQLSTRQTGEVDEADVDEEVLLKGLDDLSAFLVNIQSSDDTLRGEISDSWTEDRDSAKPPKLVRPSERRKAPGTAASTGVPTCAPTPPSTSTSSWGSVSSTVFLCPRDDQQGRSQPQDHPPQGQDRTLLSQ